MMLKLVLGRINSGKTTYIQTLIKDCVRKGESRAVLLVPEQFSFESEKRMIRLLGEKAALEVEVCGFSRLAQNIVGENQPLRRLDDAGMIALMSTALEQTADKLSVYGKYAKSTAVISEMLTVSTELKQGAVTPEMLEKSARKLPDGMLKNKLMDLSLVTSAFDSLVAQSFSDERDLLTVLAHKLEEEHYFKNATVFVDGFKGFTAQEIEILSHIIAQSNDTYISLCTDKIYGDEYDISPFACVRATARKLIDTAKKRNVSVGQVTPPEFEGRYKSKAIEALEKSLYSSKPKVYNGEADEVCVFSAKTAYEECDFVALTIKKLLREENYRCRDIAVISRSEGSYSKVLRSALKKHGVPVFEDKRRPMAVCPPVVAARALVEIAARGISSDAVFRLLKTQLAGLDTQQTGELENYVYLWRIDGSKWLGEWVANPSGLGSGVTAKDAQVLEKLNTLREKSIAPLVKYINATKMGETARDMAAALYNCLTEYGVQDNLKTLAVALDANGETAEAVELGRIWDSLMNMLDQLAGALGDLRINASRFYELFTLVLGVQDMGVIPAGIDEIIIGSADRIRVNRPRAVFAVGVNDGVFPKKPSSGRVLNEADRRTLTDIGLNIVEPFEYAFLEERHIAYNALCCADERLYVSYCSTDFGGNECAPSELVVKVKACLPDCKQTDIKAYSPLELIESEASAFELLALSRSENSSLGSTLELCFEDRSEYADKIEALNRIGKSENFRIEDAYTATKFFGNDIHASATRIEDFNKCPFMFFCRHGLKLGELKRAEIDSMLSGTVVHFVLENLVAKFGKGLVELSEEQIKKEIEELLNIFLEENMGGTGEKDARFVYLYSRLVSSLCVVAARLVNEMKLSDFEPADFELQIGSDTPEVPALEINLPDGGKVVLNGKVDRVDVLKTEEQTFVRVMDYKTGSKSFKLVDVLHGLNMQMLLYLFAIRANGKERYGNVVPAGVLYVPAKGKGGRINHSDSKEDILNAVVKEGRMTGLVLDDDRVIHSTDRECTGTVIAGKSDMAESLISLEALGKLEDTVLDIVREMGTKLHKGFVEPKPVSGGTYSLPCDYCAYADICLREEGAAVNDYPSMKHKDCIELLMKEGTEDAEMD
ncbi:MAG: PD-(D/E)XK nuclease family protein [Clostridia bacterium]|nr:PD-(D/E)XK nuclease family protein [Clostridia bacterium]